MYHGAWVPEVSEISEISEVPGVTAGVAIVGAGPAGSWAACCLARRGARVTIFDASHPREKPCGGGVTGRALELASGIVDLSRLAVRVITQARFADSAGRQSVTVPLTADGAAAEAALVVASRADFDAALLAAAINAGAELRRERVTDVSVDSGGVALETTAARHRAEFVIGADGANSLVRRRLARPFRRDELSLATGYFAHGVTSHEIVLEVAADPPGYYWSFPRPSHLAIGVCAQADAGVGAAELRRRTTQWIADAGLAAGARLEAYSWPIPSLGQRSLEGLELAGSRWCLIGDAAGLVDPITREGISFAMISGQRIAEALAGDDASEAYARQVRAEIVSELIRAARLKAGFFRPAFSALLFDALGESAAVRAVMADLIAGRQGYAGLNWRLLASLEVGLAWRTLTSMRRTRRGP